MAKENHQFPMIKGIIFRRTISQPIFNPVKQLQWKNFQPAKYGFILLHCR